jgi:hypothetical protein
MTTLATIFGILPIAVGLGAGAESRKPLGMAVVGGMIFSTLLTLVVVPVVYTLLARFAGDPRKVEAAEAATHERMTGALPAHASARASDPGPVPATGSAPGLSD